MASQDPSTAYGAAPEKPKSFFSSFPSFSLPKLPDFFGTGSTTPAPAPAPAPASAPAPGYALPGGRRRRGSKKAGRRTRRSKKGGIIPPRFLPGYKPPASPSPPAEDPKVSFGPTQVRKGKGRTRRVKKHSRR